MQVAVDALEEALQPLISPVEVNPLGEAEAQDDVVFWLLSFQQLISFQHIVALWKGRENLSGCPRKKDPPLWSPAPPSSYIMKIKGALLTAPA